MSKSPQTKNTGKICGKIKIYIWNKNNNFEAIIKNEYIEGFTYLKKGIKVA